MKWMIIVCLTVFLGFGFTVLELQNDIAKIPTTTIGEGLKVGNKIPDIVLESPSGKTMKLSKLKGQYVLVDFWASWCGPCRKENPNLVAAYRKYKGAKLKNAKGFTVFGVSLDKDAARWKAAIEQDGLKWKYHVSDLKGWSSDAAKQFKITSIPSNFLIGPDQTIIAVNLRGQALHEVMDDYVIAL